MIGLGICVMLVSAILVLLEIVASPVIEEESKDGSNFNRNRRYRARMGDSVPDFNSGSSNEDPQSTA